MRGGRREPEAKFESQRLTGKLLNAGNLDGALSVLRVGLETGWDPVEVGKATMYTGLGNLP